MTDRDAILRRLLERHGRTYAEEAGIDLDRGGPAALFQLLVLALLLSARISGSIALAAARALFDRDDTTPRKMVDASWQDRAVLAARADLGTTPPVGLARGRATRVSRAGRVAQALGVSRCWVYPGEGAAPSAVAVLAGANPPSARQTRPPACAMISRYGCK